MRAYRAPEERAAEARAIRHRLLGLLPAGTYALDRFLSLADVVVDERAESACVDIGPQPVMHLNAKFVRRHCARDEHLLMLVMHELYHVILGHTGMWPRITLAHNIAFDAVVNAILCRQFPAEAYVSFFRKINRTQRLPGRLLRPPSGWPRRAEHAPGASHRERAVVRGLYLTDTVTTTHQEVLDLLAAEACDMEGERFTLLGDHEADAGGGDREAVADPLVRDLLGRMVDAWPDEERAAIGRSLGGDLLGCLLPRSRTPRAAFLIALKRLLDRAGALRPDGSGPYAWRRVPGAQQAVTALPNWQDRRAEGHRVLLGVEPLLYQLETPVTRPRWMQRTVAHVYLDVSGSMDDWVPWLVGALDPLHRRGIVRTFAFSTIVHEVGRGRLAAAEIRTTGGTDIRAVYDHLLALPRGQTPARAVIVTDGYTGEPAPEQHTALRARGVALCVGITAYGTRRDLAPYAAHIEDLPPLR